MNKKEKGDLAELQVASELIRVGWKVLFPYGEDHRYDLVAERQGNYRRIQVKYATPNNGVLNVNCRSSNNWSVINYSAEDIDVLAVFNPESSVVYFIPVSEINKSLFKLRLVDTKNLQEKKIHPAEQFLVLS
ncbi:MAG TPA: group I intron-associated PD-(D/E)XK endonuclease [Candidatus Saccharimonadales bacterium]|nr:group I intron-associated PD-(D/E)XK endonuclease [Candidatus Saccharimonadales bacterium]